MKKNGFVTSAFLYGMLALFITLMLGISGVLTLIQANMEANTGMVASGAVTNAVRDTTIDGREIKKDDYMGIVDGKIVTTDLDLKEAAIKMVKAMLDEDSEIVTILYGAGGDQKTAEEIKAAVEEVDDELDIQIYDGGQPVYPYLISVE